MNTSFGDIKTSFDRKGGFRDRRLSIARYALAFWFAVMIPLTLAWAFTQWQASNYQYSVEHSFKPVHTN